MNLIFVIIGSIYTNLISSKKQFSENPDFNNRIQGSNNNTMKCPNNNAVLNVEHATTPTFNAPADKMKTKSSSLLDRFFSCFCIVKNSSIITSDSLGTDSIEVIHGMR